MRFKVPLFAQVIVGVSLGALLGFVFGKDPIALGVGNEQLGELGMLVIRLLKALAVPLVLFAILDAFLTTQLSARGGLKLVIICALNVSVAFAIGLTLMNVLRPGEGSRAAFQKLQEGGNLPPVPTTLSPDALSPLKALQGWVPESLVDPFLKNAIIPVVLLALLFGAALRELKNQNKVDLRSIETLVHGMLQVLVLVLGCVVRAVPFAVLGLVAQVVSRAGLGVFVSLAPFLGVVLLGMGLHAFGYYPLVVWLVAKRTPREFLGKGADAFFTGLSTNSSLATVPVVAVAIAFVIPVDWILARARSGVNVMSDLTVAVLLDGPRRSVEKQSVLK